MTTDAYQEYVEQRRERVVEQEDLVITPTLTERDCRVILDLIYIVGKSAAAGDKTKLLSVQNKIEAALTEARSR